MKRFICYVTTLLVILLGSLGLVNYFVDPANIYSDRYVDEIISGIKQGKNVTNIYDMDDRVFKRRLIEINKGKHYNTLAFGASRMMNITAESLQKTSFLNVSVSGATVNDFVAIFEICKENEITWDNIYITLDPYIFNDNYKDNRWESLSEFYYRFKGKNKSSIGWGKISNLVSPSYFQSSFHSLLNNILGHGNKKEIEYVDSKYNENATWGPDGVRYLGTKQKSQKEIDENVKSETLGKGGKYDGFIGLDRRRCEDFELLLDSMLIHSKKIYFLKLPYHPLTYNNFIENSCFKAGNIFYEKVALERGISIIGSYNPNESGFNNTDFIDGYHIRNESVKRIIPN